MVVIESGPLKKGLLEQVVWLSTHKSAETTGLSINEKDETNTILISVFACEWWMNGSGGFLTVMSGLKFKTRASCLCPYWLKTEVWIKTSPTRLRCLRIFPT